MARYLTNFTPPNEGFYYPYTTTLLMHFDSYNDSIEFKDEASGTLSRVGDAKISTAQSKFGGSSGYFDGNGDYLTVDSAKIVTFPADFTIEFWVYGIGSSNSSYMPIFETRAAVTLQNIVLGFMMVSSVWRPDFVFSTGRLTRNHNLFDPKYLDSCGMGTKRFNGYVVC